MTFLICAIFLWTIILGGTTIQSKSCRELEEPPEECSNDKLNYFVFSQHLPNAFCLRENDMSPGKCVIDPEVSTWAIHGLWPSSYVNEMCPVYCGNDTEFNESAIQPLQPQLQVVWPDLFKASGGGFWGHEWCKHGTCCSSIGVKEEVDYFTMGIKLAQKYNISGILEQSNIVASSTTLYETVDIVNSLKAALTIDNFKLFCLTEKVLKGSEKRQWLYELEFCMDTNLAPLTCPPKNPAKYFKYALKKTVKHKKSELHVELCSNGSVAYCPAQSKDGNCIL